MRRKATAAVWIAILTVMAPGLACASTTLYLPHQFQPSEMSTVGFALINPSLSTANLTFKLRNAQGSTIAAVSSQLVGKAQFAKTILEVFPANTASGTFSVDTDVEEVFGLWMYGDFQSSTDGARMLSTEDAISSPGFSYLTPTSEISFMNLGTSSLSGTLFLVNAAGTTVATTPYSSVAPQATYQRTVASLFPSQAASFASAGYWIAFGTTPTGTKIIGTTIHPNSGKDNVVTNAVNSSSNSGAFPHVVGGAIGGTTFDSVLTMVNYRASTLVTLTLRQASGAILTAQQTIPQSGVLRANITTLFSSTSVDGWLQVDSVAGSSLSGSLVYTDTATGGSTSVEMQSATSGVDSSLLFGHIANVNPWWTGLALSNPSTSLAAQVEVYAFDSGGRLIAGPAQSGAATFSLPPLTKRAFLIDEVLPVMKLRTTDGGYIHVRTSNGVNIHGIELFFLRSGKVYSNVPAVRVTRLGLAYLPTTLVSLPGGETPGTISSGSVTMERAYFGDSSNSAITSVTPCSTITLNITVNNTTGRTVSVTREYRAIGPNGYVLYMASVARDQVNGRSSNASTVTVPCDAPAGAYTFIATVDYNGILSSTSGTSTVTTSTTGGIPGGTTGGTGSCTPSETTICVLTVDYDGATWSGTGGACYDTYSQGSVFSSFTLLAQGGAPSTSGYTWTVANGSALPQGLTLEANGILRSNGARILAGTFTVVASDGTRSASRAISIAVETRNSDVFSPSYSGPCGTADFQQPQSRNVVLPNAPSGKPYGASLEAIIGRFGTLTWTLASGSLPPGLFLSSTGVVYGAPQNAVSGTTYRFQVSIRTSNPNPSVGPIAGCGGNGCPTYAITIP